jgi:3-methyladenine DNA glycosylase AlkD
MKRTASKSTRSVVAAKSNPKANPSIAKAAVRARKPASTPRSRPLAEQLDDVVKWLEASGSKRVRDGMARYAIPSDNALGISVGALRQQAKRLRSNHELALALWDTGWYEARMLATFIDDPQRVTAAQMDRWCRDFDNWAIVDTACFALFDRTPHAWAKVAQWAGRRDEFVKRAAFALLWSLTVHDRVSGDQPFLRALALVERGATDDRHFVSKAVNMALRATGKRSAALNAAAIATAQRLATSTDAAPRWVGQHALRELTGASVKRRLAAKRER